MLRIRLTLTLLCLTITLQPLRAQTASSLAGESWLNTLARPAGMIFSGTVVAIEPEAARDRPPSAVRVTFRVDDAVRGCVTGDTIAISEWAGPWSRADRYRPGEKLLLFLYARNGKGLTSPVAGDLGVLRLGPQGALQLTSAQAELFGLTHPALHSPARPVRARVGTPPAPLRKEDVVARIREAQ